MLEINTIFHGRKSGRTKDPLDESERGSEKVGLKLNTQKTKIMASGPITSWEIDGETVETVADFINNDQIYNPVLSTKIMTTGSIISWQKDRGKVETVTDFIFLGSKITADCACSLAIKRCLLLGKKAMTNLDSMLKSRDITLLIKVCLVKAMVFPVVVYGYESWTIKKAEHQRIDNF